MAVVGCKPFRKIFYKNTFFTQKSWKMKEFIICPNCGAIELAEIKSRLPERWDFYRCTKCKQLIPGDERHLAKAISIKQPWSFLIASGIKDIENRTWKTKFRGRVLIHAGKAKAKFNFSNAQEEYFKSENMRRWYDKDYNHSAIIGSAEIVDCLQNHPSIWAEKILEPKKEDFLYTHCVPNGIDSFDGDSYDIAVYKFKKSKPIYNWVLANPVLFEKPILNVKGKLSFFIPKIELIK